MRKVHLFNRKIRLVLIDANYFFAMTSEYFHYKVAGILDLFFIHLRTRGLLDYEIKHITPAYGTFTC
jgi:hypothetical protein